MAGIDYDKLRQAVRTKMREEGLSQKQVAGASGVGPKSVWNFVTNGQRPSPDNFVRFCAWLGMPYERFAAGASSAAADESTLSKIDSAIMHDQSLSTEDANKLSDLMHGAYRSLTR